MGILRPDDVPVRDRAAQLVELGDGRLLVRHRAGLSLLSGVSRSEAEALLERVDGERTAAAAVDGAPDPRRARGLLAALAGDVVRTGREDPPGPSETARAPVLVVLASGGGGVALAERLAATVAPGARLVELAPTEGEGGDDTEASAGLARALEGAALVVAALEAVPYRRLFALEQSCLERDVPVLFVTADPDGVRVGPAVLPGGATPCLACSLLAALAAAGLPRKETLEAGARLATGTLEPERAHGDVGARVAREVAALLGGTGRDPEPRCLGELVLLRPEGPLGPLRVPAHEDCPVCGGGERSPGAGEPAPKVIRRAERHRALRMERESPIAPAPGRGAGLRVGILGGGTAGGLAALAFRAKRPQDRVTMIRSRDVPPIGVGEATTPLMPQFLHADLGLGAVELFREVRPTFKLGIRFEWGARGSGSGGFPYPFGPVRPLDAATWDGHLDGVSLQAALMAAGALPVEEDERGRLRADFGTEVAYHLDNRRFAAYLERLAVARGVEIAEAHVSGVERRAGADGEEEVAALVAEDGRRLDFDLYVDCSGFRSLLLGEALGSPFVGYEGSLFTDRAVVGAARHGGRLPPRTEARTLAAGWSWSIPQEEADHVGYVFSSRCLDPERAAAELRRLRPSLAETDLREVRFAAGRREHFWRGNVVALGNAYGFVEPLESTALHLLIRQIGLLVRALPNHGAAALPGCAGALRPLLNRRVAAFWDYVRWFLALHFRFNRRLDTPFWRACREEVDVSAHGELLELYRERGPLGYDPAARSLFDYPDPLWGPEGVDTILLGQGVPCRLPVPALAEHAWRRKSELYRRIAGRSLAQEEVLRRLPDHPEVLAALEAGFRARGPAF
jgi:tryptophan halogenase